MRELPSRGLWDRSGEGEEGEIGGNKNWKCLFLYFEGLAIDDFSKVFSSLVESGIEIRVCLYCFSLF